MKLAVDLLITRGRKILFVVRKFPPFQGKLALPGGFVEEGESTEAAACRELREETTVAVGEEDLRLIGVFSEPGRDPRGHVVSIAYCCRVPIDTEATAGDDAAKTVWLTAKQAMAHGLAFDHAEILGVR